MPNFKGKVGVGLDSSDTDFNELGKTGGEKTHTLTVNEIPSHTHQITRTGSTGSAGYNSYYQSNNASSENMNLSLTGGNQSHNNLQPYTVVNYIIKAKKSTSNLSNQNDSRLVAESILTEASSVLEITGLDIIRDGGIYDIVIAEFDTVDSPSGHVLRVNDKNTGYSNTHIYNAENNVGANSGATDGLCFTNGWSMGASLFYTTGTLIYFNKGWIGFNGMSNSSNIGYTKKTILTQKGELVSQNINNITSLRIVPRDTGKLIGAGSYIKVYKR